MDSVFCKPPMSDKEAVDAVAGHGPLSVGGLRFMDIGCGVRIDRDEDSGADAWLVEGDNKERLCRWFMARCPQVQKEIAKLTAACPLAAKPGTTFGGRVLAAAAAARRASGIARANGLQKWLADQLGTTSTDVSLIIRDVRIPMPKRADHLARILGWSPEYMAAQIAEARRRREKQRGAA